MRRPWRSDERRCEIWTHDLYNKKLQPGYALVTSEVSSRRHFSSEGGGGEHTYGLAAVPMMPTCCIGGNVWWWMEFEPQSASRQNLDVDLKEDERCAHTILIMRIFSPSRGKLVFEKKKFVCVCVSVYACGRNSEAKPFMATCGVLFPYFPPLGMMIRLLVGHRHFCVDSIHTAWRPSWESSWAIGFSLK